MAMVIRVNERPKRNLNHYVLPLDIITKGEKFPLAPLYLRSLYAKLEESIANMVKFMGRSFIDTHVGSCFLLMFV